MSSDQPSKKDTQKSDEFVVVLQTHPGALPRPAVEMEKRISDRRAPTASEAVFVSQEQAGSLPRPSKP